MLNTSDVPGGWPVLEPAPTWFSSQLLASAREGSVLVQGGNIAYRVHSPMQAAEVTLLLVHGGRANARWWDATIASLDQPPLRIVSMDLSGHGESQRRRRYSAETWLEEITAVAEREAPNGCIVVGHSLGGGLALRLAQLQSPLVTKVVTVDAAPGGPLVRRPAVRIPGTSAVFGSREEGMAAFTARKRSWPLWLSAHVAVHSLRRSASGWQWKHDERARGIDPFPAALKGPWTCPVTVLLGEKSPLTPPLDDDAWWGQWSAGKPIRRIEIPGAGHDIMMENPLGFSSLLQQVCLTS